ncbi:hypothetical protein DFH09DRAFT_1086227 [Mycena vulgaris]|nr:hypothetical protein DFH09DRAFT_1086227 [Mycena vulgaris]
MAGFDFSRDKGRMTWVKHVSGGMELLFFKTREWQLGKRQNEGDRIVDDNRLYDQDSQDVELGIKEGWAGRGSAFLMQQGNIRMNKGWMDRKARFGADEPKAEFKRLQTDTRNFIKRERWGFESTAIGEKMKMKTA